MFWDEGFDGWTAPEDDSEPWENYPDMETVSPNQQIFLDRSNYQRQYREISQVELDRRHQQLGDLAILTRGNPAVPVLWVAGYYNGKTYIEVKGNVGLVVVDNLNVRAGPGTQSAIIHRAFLQPGMEIQILETRQVGSNVWYKISLEKKGLFQFDRKKLLMLAGISIPLLMWVPRQKPKKRRRRKR